MQKLQRTHCGQRSHRCAGRAQPDHGAAGRGGRLQGDLSERRIARLAQMRYRGEPEPAGAGRGGGRHARGVQAADRARCRRRLGRSGACAPDHRAVGGGRLRRHRDRGPAAAAPGRASRRHRSSGADRIHAQEDRGGARRAHRSRPGHHRPHQCAARRRPRRGDAARGGLSQGRRRHAVLLHAQRRGAAHRGRARCRRP